MSRASHAFGLLVHWYQDLLNKEAGRRWAERTGCREMRATMTRARSQGTIDTVEPLEQRTLLTAAADWTVMVYLNGDNNLEKACIQALAQLEVTGSSDKVNIVVELDRSPGSPIPGDEKTKGYDDSHGNWTDTERGLVARASTLDMALGRFATPLVGIGEKDMGSPATLKDFATWSVTNYPATHYALFIKDHGGGLDGISYDDTDRGLDKNPDHISVAGLATALQGVVKPDVIVADACRMGMTEVAYEWRNSADFLVASEPVTESDWFVNGVFKTTIANLVASPSGVSGRDLAVDVVADVEAYAPGVATLAAIDLSQMEPLALALNNLATAALGDPDTWGGISTAFEAVPGYSDPAYGDLGHILDQIPTTAPSLGSFAAMARTALDAAIVTAGTSPAEAASGLSIYCPDQGMSISPLYTPSKFAFVNDTSWDEFLRAFAKGAIRDKGVVDSHFDFEGILLPGPGGTLWYSGTTNYFNRTASSPPMQNVYGLYSPSTNTYDSPQPVPGVPPYPGVTSAGVVFISVENETVDSDGHLWLFERELVSYLDSDGVTIDVALTGNIYVQEVVSTGVYGPRIGYDAAADRWIFNKGMSGHFSYDGGRFTGITVEQAEALNAVPYVSIFDACVNTDGNVWFTAMSEHDTTNYRTVLGRISPAGTVTYFTDYIDGAWLAHITAGPDGNVWFTQFSQTVGRDDGAINCVAPDGSRTIISVGATFPEEIVAGPDGNLWYTSASDPVIYRMTTDGSVIAAIPHTILLPNTYLSNLTSADGAIWYRDSGGTAPGYGPPSLYQIRVGAKDLTVGIAPAADQPGTTNNSHIKFTVTFTQPVDDFDATDVTLEGTAGATHCDVTNPSGDHMTYDVVVSGMTRNNGMVGISIAEDVAHNRSGDGNSASPDLDVMVWYDATPLTVTVNQAADQDDPTSASQAKFDIVFNKPVRSFYDYNVTVGGTAPGTRVKTLTNPSGDKMTWELVVTGMTGYGTVTASVAAGWAMDAAGNSSQASTSTDNVVTYQPFAAAPPAVTINQAAGQADPTTGTSVSFTAVFNSEVTDFTASDITLTGTAPGAAVALVTDSGDHKTYTITVNGMTGSGTVIASVGIGQAHDVFGQGNFASTSHDNTVTYSVAGAPTVTVAPTGGAPNPTGLAAYFTIVFNRPVADFGAGDLVLGGTAPGTLTWSIVSSVGQMTYNIRVTGMTGSGTVTATVPAGVAHASTGEANLASTNDGNVVAFEYMRATEYATPSFGAGSVITGPDGNLWIAEYYSGKIARRAADGTTTEYAVGATYPESLCIGPDGNLWFTAGNTKVGKITMSGVVTLYNAPLNYNEYVNGITAGPDGNLWTTGDDSIGKLSTSGVVLGRYVLGSGTAADGITVGPDGNLWFTAEFSHKIGRITTSGVVTWFNTGVAGDWLTSIVAGPDGALWFTEASPGGRGAIGRITTSGVVSEFTAGLSSQASPWAITVGADGNLWYGGSYVIGRITPSGAVTEFAVPGHITNITRGPDNNIWFADDSTFKIGKLAPTQELPVSINQAPTQGDPAWAQPIHYTITFGSPVTDFTANKLVFGGTAAGTPSATVTDSGNHMTFDVAVSGLTGSGTLTVSLASGSVHDADGNASQNASSTDNVVVYYAPDVTPPTVTIDQAADQSDFTNVSPIHFQAVFSEPVADFNHDDVLVGGTAGGNAVVVGSGDYMTFDVWVTNLTGNGLITVTIPAGLVRDFSGNVNLESTSTDNQVVYDTTAPTVTINQAAGQADPAYGSGINFTVVFSEPVLGFGPGDITLGGTAPGARVGSVTDSGDHMTYSVLVSGMTGDGTVVATIDAGAAHDAAGNASLASTSSDNAVTYSYSFLVSTTADSGPGSLRDAIVQANARPGSDRITFNIPGSGVQTIVPLTPLPAITDALDITGATQSGYTGSSGVAASPVVWIDGRTLDRDPYFRLSGLDAKATVSITALGIAGFEHNILLELGATYSTVQGCYLGVDPTGRIDWQVVEGAAVNDITVYAAYVTIGGASAEQRNVIAGSGYAIESDATYNDTGTAIIGFPVYLTIQGNYLGTNATGDTVVGSQSTTGGIGTVVLFDADYAMIGGPNPGEGNVIGGDSTDLLLWGGRHSTVQNNNLQIKPNGIEVITSAVAPFGCIELDGARGYDNTICGNVMGGNQGNGILFDLGAHDNLAQDNYIGVDRSVTYNLGRPDNYNGVYFRDSTNNSVFHNVIGNFRKGIRVGYPQFGHTSGNIITGNYIGVGPAGQDIGNRSAGIFVGWGDNNVIGSTNPGGANVIANNGRDPAGDPAGGIVVMLGTGNSIRGNSIYHNAGLGIDLGGEGATPNDPLDADTGANGRQNTPIMYGVLGGTGGNPLTPFANLDAAPNTTYTIDYYVGEPSATGDVYFGALQGKRWIYSKTVTTDATGHAYFYAQIPWSEAVPAYIVETATDRSGNTSEFSYLGVPSLALPHLSVGDISVSEGNSGTTDATFTLTLDRVSDQDILVDVYTQDGTATSGSDYQSVSTTVTIPAGTTTASVTVSVYGDTPVEPDETFTLNLGNVTNAVLSNSVATCTILNDDVLVDAGGTFATALRVGNGTDDPSSPIAAEISPANDVDLYYFIVQAGTTATFTINSGGSGLDSYLRLFDHNGNELAANDDTSSADSEITYTFSETGTYYIGVSGLANTSYNPVDGSGAIDGSTGGYTLNIKGLPMQDVIGYERFADAWLVDSNQPLRTTISSDGDYDLYRLSITDPAALARRFKVDAAFGAVLRIFDASGAELYNSSTHSGWTGQTDFIFPGTGDYYVGISGQGNDAYNPADTVPATVPGSQGEYTFTMEAVTVSPFSITDGNLEQAIRDQLANDGYTIDPATPLTEADLLNLISLDASGRGITDLRGLEYATNLQSLTLSADIWGATPNNITDLAAIMGLSQLQSLDVSGNAIGDAGLAQIAAIKSLTTLNLSNCALTSLAALAPSDPADPNTGMPNLTDLNVSSNWSLTDYSAVSTMPSLQRLDLSSCGLSDTAPLNGLTNLTSLNFGNNTSLVSLVDIATLTNLRTLYLWNDTSLTDLSGLTNLTSLQILHLGNVPVGQKLADSIDWSAFQSLWFLSLSRTGLTDINFLTLPSGDPAMPNLTTLDVQANSLTSLDGVGSYKALQSLYATYNNITDISAVAGCTALRYLTLYHNQVADLSPLAGLANLDNLTLSYNNVASLAGLDWSTLTLLRALYIDHNSIRDLTPLSGHANLSELYLAGNHISDLSPLSTLHKLYLADLTGNCIVTLQTANWPDMTNLRYLYLSHNGINTDPASADGQIIQALTDRGVYVDVSTQDYVSTIHDHNLEQAIRDQLGLGASAPVTQADVESLTRLDASYRGITDLTGLEFATNLATLSIRGNPVSDLTPILDLSLDTLDVSGIAIGASGLADIASHLTNLTHLEVQSCNIDDFSSLSSLTSLQSLNVTNNANATGWDALASLTNLQGLYAANTGLPATALTPLNSLRDLDVGNCGITDISFLAGKQLSTLNLGGNPISNLSWLSTQATVWWLNLGHAGLQPNDIASVDWSKLTGLGVFFLDGNHIGSLSFLAALPQLLSLGANDTGITDISPLASQTGIHYLSLSDNPIADLSPLNDLAVVEQINLDNCGLTSLGQVQWSKLTSLRGSLGVAVRNNHLSTFAGGADAQIIADLRANDVNVYASPQCVRFDDAAFESAIRTALSIPTDPVPSDAMLTLTSLDLSGHALTSIAGIEYAESLTSLNLRHTGLDLAAGSPERKRVDLLIARGVAVAMNALSTDISLSGSSVAENRPIGTVVGNFTTTDPDAGDTFRYSLVGGDGSTDNGHFTISGNQLKTAEIFNLDTSYSIRVRTTDADGVFFEKVFVINITPITLTWNGATGNWTDAGNWSTSGAFPNNGSFTYNVIMNSGTVTLDRSITIRSLTLGDGASLKLGEGTGTVLTVDALSITGSGKLDLTSNTLLVKYSGGVSPIGEVVNSLKSGRNGGTWDGSGINSSAAAANSSYGVGVVDDAANQQVKVMYTLLGDTNLDSHVDVGDLGTLLNHYGQTGNIWSDGEFAYNTSGTVDVGDLGLLLNNYGQSIPVLAGTTSEVVSSDAISYDTVGTTSEVASGDPITPSYETVGTTSEVVNDAGITASDTTTATQLVDPGNATITATTHAASLSTWGVTNTANTPTVTKANQAMTDTAPAAAGEQAGGIVAPLAAVFSAKPLFPGLLPTSIGLGDDLLAEPGSLLA